MRRSQTEVGQARVIVGSWCVAVPEEFALTFVDLHVVDAGVAVCHEAVFVVQPVLVAVGAEPLARIVTILVGKTDRDAVLAVRPQLFDEAVLVFAAPLAAPESR